ncbi:MAG TPA: flagellar biosynthetic protein FliR [Polyangiaceae bacterium]|nr:flagellar biosynthetic protein FliR [Polyangiaceae bacterium]
MTPFDFDALIRAEAAAFSLEAVRIAGLIITAPLAWSGAPARVRAALVVLLTLAVHGQGTLSPELASSASRIAASVGTEFLLGAAMGMIARLSVAAVEVAAEQIGMAMGLGVAQVFDPQAHGPHNVLGGILRNLALVVALGVGLHRTLLGALIASFRGIPPGSLLSLGLYGETFTSLGSLVFSTGVRLSMPIIAVLLMAQVALAFVSRAAPTMQVFSVGFAVTLGVGAFVLVLSLPDLAQEIAADMSQVQGRIETLLSAALEAPR